VDARSPLLSPVTRRNFFLPLLFPTRRINFSIEIRPLLALFLIRQNRGGTGEETAEGTAAKQAKTAVG
jgi:hypothetical protein